MNIDNRISEVLSFWYGDEMKKQWFSSTPELDADIKQQFESLWEEAANHKLDSWKQTAEGCLALCIVLDQFPLNMFRGEAKAFDTEQQAVAITKHAIEKGFDNDIDDSTVSFLYMPLMHSENLNDQDLSVKSFKRRKLDGNIRFAEHHRGLIVEFGRFPHRNETLGRVNTAEEVEYLQSERAFKG
ncbi:DUF924 family protein [uncultured Cocleimonas sp.]|uniref:DUF924 family protein n=1 Tax=uncultured Cocleimonas sp. TaxID=1051587 RepID=UPI0026199C63|nr:DUF924 family protein [uncultured Cocleimonas sp.]